MPAYSYNPAVPSSAAPTNARAAYGLSSPDLQSQQGGVQSQTQFGKVANRPTIQAQGARYDPSTFGYLPANTGYQQYYQQQNDPYGANNPYSMQQPGYYEQNAPAIIARLQDPGAGDRQLGQVYAQLGQPLQGSENLQGYVSNLGIGGTGQNYLSDTYRAWGTRPLEGSSQISGVYNTLAQAGQGEQGLRSVLGAYQQPMQGTGQMQDVYGGLQGQGTGGQMMQSAYSSLGQGSPYAAGLENVYGRAMNMGPGEGAMGLALAQLSGQSPATGMYQDVYGGYGQPGASQQFLQGYGGQVMDMAGAGNPLTGALDSFNRNRADLATSANLDPYYDRAIQKGIEDVDAQAAARGAYGSSAALDQGRELTGGLRAEQANREADYALRRAAEMRGWEGLGGELSGALASSRLGAAGLGGTLAQSAGQERLAGLSGQLGAAGAIGEDALQRGRSIADVGSLLSGAERGRLGLAADTGSNLMQDVLSRQLGQQSGAQAYGQNELARLQAQGDLAQGLANVNLQQLSGQQSAAQGLSQSELQRALGQLSSGQALQQGDIARLQGQGSMAQALSGDQLQRALGQISGSEALMGTDLARILGQGNIANSMNANELARLTAALPAMQNVQGMRENRIQQGFDNISGFNTTVGSLLGQQLGGMYDADAASLDAVMGTTAQKAQAALSAALGNQQQGQGLLNAGLSLFA